MDERSNLVSVVIPSYNHGHLIGRAITSVLTQTYENYEIIVVDNNSIDETDNVLAEFVGKRLKILKVNNGGSIGYSRNRGVDAARGDWVAFLDSDDWWMPDKLLRCSEHFSSADMIYHRLVLTNGSALQRYLTWSGSWRLKSPVLDNLLKRGNPVATSSVVVRSSIFVQIGFFDESTELVAAEDYDAWIRLAKITERFHFIPNNLGFYHLSSTGASSKDMSLPMRATYKAHSEHMTCYNNKIMDANAAYAAGRFAYQYNQYTVAALELRKSFFYGHLELKIRSLILISGLIIKIIRFSLGRLIRCV